MSRNCSRSHLRADARVTLGPFATKRPPGLCPLVLRLAPLRVCSDARVDYLVTYLVVVAVRIPRHAAHHNFSSEMEEGTSTGQA